MQHFVNVLFLSASDEDEENKQGDFKSFVLCHCSQPVTSRSTPEQPFSHYVNKQMNELDAVGMLAYLLFQFVFCSPLFPWELVHKCSLPVGLFLFSVRVSFVLIVRDTRQIPMRFSK